jgi:hypothetical protein
VHAKALIISLVTGLAIAGCAGDDLVQPNVAKPDAGVTSRCDRPVWRDRAICRSSPKSPGKLGP